MSPPRNVREYVERIMIDYCTIRVLVYACHQVKMGFQICANQVTLFEEHTHFGSAAL